MTIDAASKQLALRVVPYPGSPDSQLQVFSDWLKAVQHLCDHVLAAPECFAWTLVAPGCLDVLDPTDAEARWRYARRAEETQGADAQPLYEVYNAAILRDMDDAGRLRWRQSSGEITVTLGTCGVLVVTVRTAPARSVVMTAFLPGQGDPELVVGRRGTTLEPPQLRREADESAIRLRRHPFCSARERRARQRRRERQTHEEQLYYDVFKPAAQFIRTRYHAQYDVSGRPHRCDYALLKTVLPRRSQLKFDDWRQCRQQCGRQERRP